MSFRSIASAGHRNNRGDHKTLFEGLKAYNKHIRTRLQRMESKREIVAGLQEIEENSAEYTEALYAEDFWYDDSFEWLDNACPDCLSYYGHMTDCTYRLLGVYNDYESADWDFGF